VDVRVLDVRRDDLSGWFSLFSACQQDWSDEPLGDYDAAIAALRNPPPTFGPELHWAAVVDSQLVGHAKVSFPDGDFGTAKVTVHPDFRGRGIGSSLLHAALPTLRSRGRTTLEGWSVTKGSPGDLWAARRGFVVVSETVLQRLCLHDISDSAWDVPLAPGYRVVSWDDRAPDDLVASYAAAQDAIQDAPLGNTSFRYARWTVERIRQAEADRRSQGIERRVVVAVEESSGEVVGYTEVELRPYRLDRAVQLGTAVLAGHRGHGLGAVIKCRMARWLRSDRPSLERVVTTSAAVNRHMIELNHRMGYVTTRTMLVVSSPVEALAARLLAR
jgi:GNAT superfamily N-acetyltransferase